MNRILIREKIEEIPFDVKEKQKVGVTGMSGGAGASFIAAALAKALSLDKTKRVTYLELRDKRCLGKPLIYDALGMDKRFAGREFIRFYEKVRRGEGIRGKLNLDERINWALATPEDTEEHACLTVTEAMRFLNNISGDMIICDVGDFEGKWELLMDMDVIVFVVDPMPSAMIAGLPNLKEIKRLEYRGKNVAWAINKMNRGINKRELKEFLKVKNEIQFPIIDAERLYAAEYNCKMPYGISEVKEQMQNPLQKLCQHITIT